MFVMASPLEAHLTETLTSLKFATKVSTVVSTSHHTSMLTTRRYITRTLEQQRSRSEVAINDLGIENSSVAYGSSAMVSSVNSATWSYHWRSWELCLLWDRITVGIHVFGWCIGCWYLAWLGLPE
jgi:hypothetical protein